MTRELSDPFSLSCIVLSLCTCRLKQTFAWPRPSLTDRPRLPSYFWRGSAVHMYVNILFLPVTYICHEIYGSSNFALQNYTWYSIFTKIFYLFMKCLFSCRDDFKTHLIILCLQIQTFFKQLIQTVLYMW